VLFIERPITVAHVRDFCARFNEGLRIEYKRDFDANVREKLPKVISSFANSHGGVLVVGVNTLNGVPQGPFEGFEPPAREEFALTVENICLQNIYPPVLPRTTVVPSDVGNRVFLVIEVEESGEAPHAIENSKKVYVRTGNAANPYDLADVDLIIDLVKRRKEPLELRDRLEKSAERRAEKWVTGPQSYVQATICPRFPRSALCTSEEVYDFVQNARYRGGDFIDRNNLHRVPDGVAGQIPERAAASAAYEEINRFGLLFARTPFRELPWEGQREVPVLSYGDLFHTLCKFLCCAESFYGATGFRGTVLARVSLHNVAEQRMTFYRIRGMIYEDLSPNDFRCIAEVVSTERLVGVDRIVTNKLDVLTDILGELAWSFWQSLTDFPRERLNAYAAELLQLMGLR
jgi:Putative DNA-binding domain